MSLFELKWINYVMRSNGVPGCMNIGVYSLCHEHVTEKIYLILLPIECFCCKLNRLKFKNQIIYHQLWK
jgi:hypothetical protein